MAEYVILRVDNFVPDNDPVREKWVGIPYPISVHFTCAFLNVEVKRTG